MIIKLWQQQDQRHTFVAFIFHHKLFLCVCCRATHAGRSCGWKRHSVKHPKIIPSFYRSEHVRGVWIVLPLDLYTKGFNFCFKWVLYSSHFATTLIIETCRRHHHFVPPNEVKDPVSSVLEMSTAPA